MFPYFIPTPNYTLLLFYQYYRKAANLHTGSTKMTEKQKEKKKATQRELKQESGIEQLESTNKQTYVG